MNEENKNQDSRMDKLLGEIAIQSGLIIEKVKENEDEMCALIIIGSADRTMSGIHSKGGDKIVLAMANAIYRNPKLMDVMEAAMEVVAKSAEYRAINHRKTADEDETV